MLLNASLFEKFMILGSLTCGVGFIGYMSFKKPEVSAEDSMKIRQQLIQSQKVKILYSTMSFFYLQGFQSKDPQSFITLQQILNIQTPQIVALPLSRQDFQLKYRKTRSHPRFRQSMDRFKHNVKNKKTDEISNVKDFHLKNLEMIYLIDQCYQIAKCKVVYARRDRDYYKKLDQVYKKLSKKEQQSAINSHNAKIEDYTDMLISQMKPEMNFALSPQSPFKLIVGIIEPELMFGVSRRWKQKFKESYSHIVLEDQQIIKKEKEDRRKEKEFQEKFKKEALK